MTKELRVWVERIEGVRENGQRNATMFRAYAPGLGQLLGRTPCHLLKEAPTQFNTRRRFLGRSPDELTDSHIDPLRHMFFAVTIT